MVGGYAAHYNGVTHWEVAPDMEFSLDRLYGKNIGSTRTLGTACLVVDIPVKKWLSVPFTFTASMNFTPVEDSLTGISHTAYDGTMNIMAGVRFKYLNREHLNLYSALHAGLGVCNVGEFTSAELFPSIQLVPIGIRAGARVYGFAEIGVGTIYLGGQIGVGYKF